MDGEITYQKKSIDKDIRQKLRNKDVYETDMQKIYNIIVVQTKYKLQEKVASEAPQHAVKSVW